MIAEHLKSGLPGGALFGRFEDDEFAVILATDRADIAAALVEAVRNALSRPVFFERMWQITACVGIAEAPQDAATGEELARRAGLALRAAQTEGRAIVRRFEQRIETEYTERSFLLRELEAAISSRSFDVAYQPVVAADGGGIVGVEALLRWQHPTRRRHSAVRLHSARGAERPDVAGWARSCCGGRSPTGRAGQTCSSRSIFRRCKSAIRVSSILSPAVMAETAIASSKVVLEVTEGVFIDNPQETQDRL